MSAQQSFPKPAGVQPGVTPRRRATLATPPSSPGSESHTEFSQAYLPTPSVHARASTFPREWPAEAPLAPTTADSDGQTQTLSPPSTPAYPASAYSTPVYSTPASSAASEYSSGGDEDAASEYDSDDDQEDESAWSESDPDEQELLRLKNKLYVDIEKPQKVLEKCRRRLRRMAAARNSSEETENFNGSPSRRPSFLSRIPRAKLGKFRQRQLKVSSYPRQVFAYFVSLARKDRLERTRYKDEAIRGARCWSQLNWLRKNFVFFGHKYWRPNQTQTVPSSNTKRPRSEEEDGEAAVPSASQSFNEPPRKRQRVNSTL